jgi:phosphohistidine phosphatase
MGAFLRERLGSPQLATVSPALRAWETWQLLAAQLGPVPEVRTDDRIYDEWGGRMIDVVRELPEGATTAVIVGHEPGVSRLVLQLADRANPLARDRISTKFPTCAVAVLSLGMPWAEVEPGSADLESFTTPKDLRART